MHELPIVRDLLDAVLRYAREEVAKKVRRVSLEVGGMHDLVEDIVTRFFEYISEGTMAEGASLDFKRNVVLIRCRQCGEGSVFNPHCDIRSTKCKRCGSHEFDFVNGNEFIIKSIEIEV